MSEVIRNVDYQLRKFGFRAEIMAYVWQSPVLVINPDSNAIIAVFDIVDV
jgi:hypothetical protein